MGYSKWRELREKNNISKREAKELSRPIRAKKGSKKRKHGRQTF